MSKKTEPRAADMAAPMSEAAAAAEVKTAVPMEREAKTGPVVYCGPSVRGVARQYTVYAGPFLPRWQTSFRPTRRPRGCW